MKALYDRLASWVQSRETTPPDRRSVLWEILVLWLGTLLILIGWVALQVWVLPRLGVPT